MNRRLLADIGGTNTRFAVGEADRLERLHVLRNADYATFQEAARGFLTSLPKEMRISRAALAIAGRTTGDTVHLTNHHWTFSIDRAREELGLSELRVVNDFEAAALAIPHLAPADRLTVGPERPDRHGPIALVGPGTGLGVAALIPSSNDWIVVPSEGGHGTMPAATHEEARVLDLLRRRWHHVSAERVLSGPGLENIHAACRELEGLDPLPLTAADITAAAVKQEDSCCSHAFKMFCEMLGTFAGNLALTFRATGGVYVAGGILLRLKEGFAASGFRTRFEQKGRLRNYLCEIPTYLIVHPQPALKGLITLTYQRQARGAFALTCSRSYLPDCGRR
jgi:glucokinase